MGSAPSVDHGHEIQKNLAQYLQSGGKEDAAMKFLLEQKEDGEHFYSPKVADRISKEFSLIEGAGAMSNTKADEMPRKQLEALIRHYQASALQYLNSDQRQKRLRLLENVRGFENMSELRADGKQVEGVDPGKNYLLNRENAEKSIALVKAGQGR